MKFCTALTLLASAGTVLSFPLAATNLSFGEMAENSDGTNGFNDGYPTQDFAKRQNQQALKDIMNGLGDTAYVLNHDSVTRADFTQRFIKMLWNSNSNYNYVICHTAHDYSYVGTKGVDWDNQKVEWDTTDRITFDVVVGGAGYFIRHGDGGFINWAYKGNVVSTASAGHDFTVRFNAPLP